MIDPIQIKQEVQEGKLLFWLKDGILYCGDRNPQTTAVIIPCYRLSIDYSIESK